MTEDRDVADVLTRIAPRPEVPDGLVAGARRRRTGRRAVGLAFASMIAIGALTQPLLGLLEGGAPTSGGQPEQGTEGGAPAAALTLPFETTPHVDDAVSAAEQIGWEAALGGEGPNRVVSPSSLSLSLAMAAEGARGASLGSIDAALGLTGDDRAAAFGALRQSLLAYEAMPDDVDVHAPPEIPVVHQANRVVGIDTEISETYLTRLAQYFDAPATTVARDVAQATLDEWTHRNTAGLIEASGIDVTERTTTVTQDALLFAAAWRTPLNPRDDVPFAGPDGPATVDGLTGVVPGRLAEGEGWRALRLAYDDVLAADVIVPVGGAAASLTADDLAEARRALDAAPEVEVEVTMPTLDLTATTDLRAALPGIDLSDLGGIHAGATVEQWVQQARLQVSAEGTVGAAVTELATTASRKPTFTVDGPYVLRVLDTRTGWPLFLALITDPSTKK